YLTVWKFEPIWALICIMGIYFYVHGVVRLVKRGDKWPVLRTISWIAGLLMLLYTSNGALAAYANFVFSVHMLGHMLLSMAIPLLLVLGAPITLAMRAIHVRKDNSEGMREWLNKFVHSKWMGIISHPLVAAGLFSTSLWA